MNDPVPHDLPVAPSDAPGVISTVRGPDYVMARDLYLLENVFPGAVVAASEAQGISLPDRASVTGPPVTAENGV